MLLFLFVSGIIIGMVSGLLGIGGGIIITPFLLYFPVLFGLPSLSMKTITGLTMVQSLVGSASGFIAHGRYQKINRSLILWMGPTIIVSSFLGARYSSYLSDEILLGLYAFLSTVAAILMVISRKGVEKDNEEFNKGSATLIAIIVGFAGGLVGQGGSFLIVPALITVLGIPTRIALGSNLGIVLMASTAGFIGKWSSGLIEPLLALTLIAGVVPGAQLGGYFSQHIRRSTLKRGLGYLILLTSFYIWWTII